MIWEKANWCAAEQIDGWNGSAYIKLVMYVKVPKHFDEARRQRAIMGMECAAACQGRRNPVYLAKIAAGAVAGRGVERLGCGYLRHASTGVKSNWYTTVGYDFAEDERCSVWIQIKRVRCLSAGVTNVDDGRNYEKMINQLDHRAETEKEDAESQQAAAQKQMARELISQKKKEDHQQDREAWIESGMPWEDWDASKRDTVPSPDEEQILFIGSA